MSHGRHIGSGQYATPGVTSQRFPHGDSERSPAFTCRAPPLQVLRNLVAEDIKSRSDVPCHPIRMATCTPAFDFGDPPRQVVESNGHAMCQKLQLLRNRRESETAGSALACRLRRQVADEPCCLAYAATGRRKGHDQARPESDSEPGRAERSGQCNRGRYPRTEVPADQERLNGSARAASKVEHIGHTGADRYLEYARTDDGSSQGDQHRPGLLGRSHLPEPLSTVASHEGEMGKRLDVVDEGGAAPQAALGHSGRLAQWDGDPTSNPVDDGTRLACHEAVSGGHDPKPHTVKSGFSAFGQSQIDALAYIVMDDDEDLVRSNETGRKRGTIENEMGCAGQ